MNPATLTAWIDRARSFAATPGFRGALSQFQWMVADKAFRFVVSVLIGFWVARHLGPTQFGMLAYVLALVGMLQPLAEFGLEGIVKRDFLRRPAEAGTTAANARLIRLAGGGLGGLLILSFVVVGEVNSTERGLLLILSLTLFPPALLVSEAWMHARLDAKRVMPPQWLALILCALARITALLSNAGLTVFAGIAAAEVVLSACVSAATGRHFGLRYGRVDLQRILGLLREAWPLLLSSFAIVIYVRIDVLMLRRLAGEEAAGTYAAAVRVTELTYFIPVALAASVLPALLRAEAAGGDHYFRRLRQYFDFSAALAYAITMPLSIFAPSIIRLAYGPVFSDASNVLAIHAWGTIFVFLGVARGQHLVNAGLSRFSFAATSLGAVANVGLNLVMIPRWGAVGSALATILSFGTSAWISSFFHSQVRRVALAQTGALLVPVTFWRYFRKI